MIRCCTLYDRCTLSVVWQQRGGALRQATLCGGLGFAHAIVRMRYSAAAQPSIARLCNGIRCVAVRVKGLGFGSRAKRSSTLPALLDVGQMRYGRSHSGSFARLRMRSAQRMCECDQYSDLVLHGTGLPRGSYVLSSLAADCRLRIYLRSTEVLQ